MSEQGEALEPTAPGPRTPPFPWPRVSHWWIDQVGGVLAVRADRAVIGHSAGSPEIAVAGRLSRRHAELAASPSGIVLHALASTIVNEQPVTSVLLKNGDRLQLGEVAFQVYRPASWTVTCRLDLTSGHRLAGGVTTVLLLGEACVLGPGPEAHLPLRSEVPVFLLWRGDHFTVRGPAGMSVDGQEAAGPVPTRPASRFVGPWGTMAWVPVPTAGSTR